MFITSLLDMNNSLLATLVPRATLRGLPRTALAKLQRCQNFASRVITRTPATDHITPVLMNVDWPHVTP